MLGSAHLPDLLTCSLTSECVYTYRGIIIALDVLAEHTQQTTQHMHIRYKEQYTCMRTGLLRTAEIIMTSLAGHHPLVLPEEVFRGMTVQ